ncbi:hypothetical protein BHU62_11495 [Serratia marcescens]|uniref:Acyl carrier protein n=1 Tax=Serratia marcescens TaxID=615 RepID=A0A1Q4P056_SERMA|nr:hypothetical protein [Serratia marcescens]OKB66496.1 hypothetical protein BHU62_11495 [Serratia marcescens]
MEKHEIEQVLKNQIRVINHCGDSVEIAGETKLRDILDSVDILQFVFNINKEYGLSFGNNIGDEKYLTTLDKVVSWVHSAINKKAEDDRK